MKKSYTEEVGKIPKAKIAVLQAQWHSEHTDKIVEKYIELLQEAEAKAIDIHRVPGSYELPFAAKQLARLERYDAIAVFGAIVKGETDHYQVILETCIRELGKVMYDFEVPIIMELLPVHRVEDLIARCTGEHNKGIEAAQATVEIIQWRRSL
ncbi:MAG: 6,7-dimethyl-8-ribityllumazine synthase [Bdellovibrionales bacterium]|nr:6,7-dimethyl-8-ribityllumazine synthase [Bdellovibrionales bacterium]